MAVPAGGPCDAEPVLTALDFLTRGKQIASVAPPIASTSAAVPLPEGDAPISCDAASLTTVLLTHLESTGIDLMRLTGMSTDGASVMLGQHNGVTARLKVKVPHLVSSHCIAHREALAAKDAATAHPDFNIVDKVVRAVAENLGRSSVNHARFQELQEVICETHLEVQGIKDVRWLSRGDAIQRLVKVFPAAVMVLHETNKKMYQVVTSYKFHFLLFFLADVLKELNLLSLKFQRRQVDATHVLPMVHNTTLLLRTRYLDCDDATFGQGGDALGPFLDKHASGEFREVLVAGTASDGTSVSHRYRLHEEKIKGQKSGVDHQACLGLAREFIATLVGRLDYRLKDLSHLDGAKLFK
ncbi:unnamed protein product [Closterium sp. Naga37s-1]|nr:unnamed protein product [Closterium sp. Naga37s-1]